MLLKQRHIVLHRLGALPQLLERYEHVAGLVDHFESYAKRSDECQVVGKWWCDGLHLLDNAGCLIGGISF